MAKTFIPFNVNDTVRVRLTDVGRKIHRARFRKLNAQLPLQAELTYSPPKEDENGWSEWQMWILINTFGEHVSVCKEPPFETNIEIQQSK